MEKNSPYKPILKGVLQSGLRHPRPIPRVLAKEQVLFQPIILQIFNALVQKLKFSQKFY